MAQNGLSVIPVVSRTNLREMTGIISLRDALDAYKSETRAKSEDILPQEKKSPVALLGGFLAVLFTVIALAAFLSYFYRTQRTTRAEEFYQQGNQLMSAERYPESIEKYRSALSISHTSRDRLALALALLQAGRLNEAGIYLREIVRDNPNSGPANLGLARIAARQGDVQEAIERYRQAMIGTWQENAAEHELETRIELIDTLGRFKRRTQAQAELLSLSAEMPADPGIQKRVAAMLLDYDLPKEAAGVYQQVIRHDPPDAKAFLGLGKAQLALENFRSAETAFKNALRIAPDNAEARRDLDLVQQVLALDPAQRGLTGTERYQRSRKILENLATSLSACIASATSEVPEQVTGLLETVQKSLENRSRPRSYSDAAEAALSSALQLWQAHTDLCGPPTGEALTIIMSRLSR